MRKYAIYRGKLAKTIDTVSVTLVALDVNASQQRCMPRVQNRSMRFLAEPRSTISASLATGAVSRADFYREEFLKHKRCLEAQREYFSEQAITKVDAALTETIAKLDHICRRCDCDHVVSCLLRQFDLVTGLSNWSDPKKHN